MTTSFLRTSERSLNTSTSTEKPFSINQDSCWILKKDSTPTFNGKGKVISFYQHLSNMDVINYINCHLSFINFSESMMKTNEKELVLQGAKLRSQKL